MSTDICHAESNLKKHQHFTNEISSTKDAWYRLKQQPELSAKV
jgi:hypothetical protein